MQATDWHFLPCTGGLLDQPQWLMDDLYAIMADYQAMKKELKNE